MEYDEKGRLERKSAEEGGTVSQGIVQLSLENWDVAWSLFVQHSCLLTVSFVFDQLQTTALDAIGGLWKSAPNLERFALKIRYCHYAIEPLALNEAMAPMVHTAVRHLVFEPGSPECFISNFNWYRKLESLTVNSFKWNIDLIPNLTSLTLKDVYSDSFLGLMTRKRVAHLTSVSLDSYFPIQITACCIWLYYFVSQRAPWTHFSTQIFSRQDKLCETESKSDKRAGEFFGYKILRKRFDNMILLNRHMHRHQLKQVLLNAALRAWPVFGNSIQDMFKMIFKLLRLV